MKRLEKLLMLCVSILLGTIESLKWSIAEGLNSVQLHRSGSGVRRNSTAVVLGNGPSLNDDLDGLHLEDSDVICVNHFVQTDLFEEIKPRSMIVLDPSFSSTDGRDSAAIGQTIEALQEKVTWPFEILIPKVFTKHNVFKEFLRNNDFISLSYYSTDKARHLRPKMKNRLIRKGLIYPENADVTVLHAALVACLTAGYRTITIVGANASWHELMELDQQTNKLYRRTKNEHFYHDADSRHELDYNVAMAFKYLFLTFRGYDDIAKLADEFGVSIRNRTNPSWIDSFERS